MKMHAPKKPGALLEPFAVGLQSWANGQSPTWFDEYPFFPTFVFLQNDYPKCYPMNEYPITIPYIFPLRDDLV